MEDKELCLSCVFRGLQEGCVETYIHVPFFRLLIENLFSKCFRAFPECRSEHLFPWLFTVSVLVKGHKVEHRHTRVLLCLTFFLRFEHEVFQPCPWSW